MAEAILIIRAAFNYFFSLLLSFSTMRFIVTAFITATIVSLTAASIDSEHQPHPVGMTAYKRPTDTPSIGDPLPKRLRAADNNDPSQANLSSC